MEALPHFTYSPNAFKPELGLFEASEEECPCCEKVRGYSYQLTPYSEEEIENLCPWCIYDGSAAAKFDASFSQDVSRNQPIAEEASEQVYARTPGYNSWQGEDWLGHCNDACVFIGYVGFEDIAHIWQEVREDVSLGGWDKEVVKANLQKEGHMVGYLFQCRHCNKHRLGIDCD